MATETELKLLLTEADIEGLRTHPRLQAGAARGCQTLFNTYYDSPDLALAQAKVALRLRRQGSRVIQTLKTRGQSVNGLHQRGEWEWERDQATLDPALLVGDVWPEGLPPAAELHLLPVFTTDFERELWDVRYRNADIEVALDRGRISCDGCAREDTILELELELKSGDALELLALADELGRQVTLQPFDLSKAQRGYQLYQQCRDTDQAG
ncbi:CYTH domain-containing protein [Marinobacterium halophilum]|uniref:CYTH domain-containing protein n=1 Tax=Marinobacterium halophilum TaxID=267374 RepID=A0A2P8EWQ8_9GAMM|nr:CYTH domain-containing protein [Marinobacterium halophilum]PSL13909.1 CYTH domain-containing protein [Marinobacterium halophilum]